MSSSASQLQAALGAVLLFLTASPASALDSTLEEGLKAAKKGDHQGAIAIYSEAIRRDPKHREAYYNRGIAYQRTLERDKAIADFTKVIELDPTSISAYTNRGNVHFLLSSYDKAIADYTEAIALNPKSWVGYKNRGGAYLTKHDYQHAITDFTEVIRLNPTDTGAYKNRGNAYHCLGAFDRAIADYDEVLNLNPINTVALCNRGDAHRAKGAYTKALVDFKEAIELNPKFSLPHKSIASILATCPVDGVRDGKKAVEHARQACELSRWEDAAEVDTLAAAHAEAGDFMQAVKFAKQYLEAPRLSAEDKAMGAQHLALYEAGKPLRAVKKGK